MFAKGLRKDTEFGDGIEESHPKHQLAVRGPLLVAPKPRAKAGPLTAACTPRQRVVLACTLLPKTLRGHEKGSRLVGPPGCIG